MERLFDTHMIRKSRECAPVWTLATLDEGGLAQPEKVTVPGIWESHPALRAYHGRGVYEQRINCGGNVRFWLGGVSFLARVFLDDALLTEHYGAYTGFEALALDVPSGEHTLRIEADNRFGDDSALHVPNDYYSYGGINRPVIMEQIGAAYIARCRLIPHKTEEGWTLETETAVRNLSSDAFQGILTLRAAGQEIQTEVLLQGDETKVFPAAVPCGNVTPWSPENPTLYHVTTQLSVDGTPVDDLIDRVGFREIRIEGKHILLNGEPLLLKGFNRHEEYGSFGVSVPLIGMMQDIHLMRDIGANCVRTCHYPNDPLFLDLCDETGLLVWEESHVRGFQEKQMRHPLFMKQLTECTREMVEQHQNHPSIFIWASLNECADDTEYGAACYREILSLLRKLDSSRPVTAALLERAGGKVYDAVDVVSVNIYPQWYHNAPVKDALDQKLKEADAGGGGKKPVIVSEIGAGAIYGYHDPFGDAKWSEERQCRILADQINAVLSHPDVTGVFLWQFADARVSEEWAIHRPKTCNNKGIVDEYRRPKLAYQTAKELFHKRG